MRGEVSRDLLEREGLEFLREGKVRDLYRLDERHLVLLATDRISAFDCRLEPPIPGKGALLTEVSRFWFDRVGSLVPTHEVTAPPAAWSRLVETFGPALSSRAMVVRRAEVVPVECVVRGRLTGSAWREYQRQGTVNGQPLPAGFQTFAPLDPPLFTPTTKAEVGHDAPLTPAELRGLVGEDLARTLETLSVELFSLGREVAAAAGLLLLDTKFEFGWIDGRLHVVDEVLTPDSSRFLAAETFVEGHGGKHLDKEFVRRYLASTPWAEGPRDTPPPPLPERIVAETIERYRQVRDRLFAAVESGASSGVRRAFVAR